MRSLHSAIYFALLASFVACLTGAPVARADDAPAVPESAAVADSSASMEASTSTDVVPEVAVTAPPVQGNFMNPNISVIGWMQGSAGHDSHDATQSVLLKEAELGLQAVVDPYSRADVFISFHDTDAASREEAYLTFLTLPAGLQARLGKFRDGFGKFNLTHAGETPFTDRPLAPAAIFGEEGLSGSGAELSWLVPNPFGLYANLTGTVQRSPTESPAFRPAANKNDLLYLGRLVTYADLSESWNLNAGISLVTAPSNPELHATTAPAAPLRDHARVAGADLTIRWKNRRQALYHSLMWQTEAYRLDAESDGGAVAPRRPHGGFSFVDYQVAQRWHLGVRGDWLQNVGNAAHTRGVLGFITYTPTEFSLFSLQTRRVSYGPGDAAWEHFLKITFNIGPHGAHPF